MSKKYQSHIIAFIGTVLILGLIFLLLWMSKIDAPELNEEEGIVVVFGDAEDGGGMPDVSFTDELTQAQQIPAPATPTRSSNNDLIVNEEEESLALNRQTIDETKNDANDEVQIEKIKEDIARADSIAKAEALAERKAKEQEAIEKANQLAALFGQTGTASGASGETASDGLGKGNPVGKSEGKIVVTDKNSNAYVPGRSVRSLPKPSSNFKQEGDVEVRIWVDCAGNVTNALAIGGTISDLATRRLAIEAAKKAKFTEGKTPQIGTITYVFTYTKQ